MMKTTRVKLGENKYQDILIKQHKNNNEYRINFIQYVQKYLETIIYLQNNILV